MRRACLEAFRAAGRKPAGELGLRFEDRRSMLRLNIRFLGHSHDTDVIAFPYDPPFGGDVVVSAHMVRRSARRLGHSALTEAATLAAHGALHLAGLSDATSAGKRRMFRLQDEVLKTLGLKSGAKT